MGQGDRSSLEFKGSFMIVSVSTNPPPESPLPLSQIASRVGDMRHYFIIASCLFIYLYKSECVFDYRKEEFSVVARDPS